MCTFVSLAIAVSLSSSLHKHKEATAKVVSMVVCMRACVRILRNESDCDTHTHTHKPVVYCSYTVVKYVPERRKHACGSLGRLGWPPCADCFGTRQSCVFLFGHRVLDCLYCEHFYGDSQRSQTLVKHSETGWVLGLCRLGGCFCLC